MTREYDDLYARHQMLAALVNVLVHDLRNPLHSATLLIEAMSSPSANIETLRTKLRAQIGKLDGLIAETNNSAKAMALEPTVEVIAVDTLLRALADNYPAIADRQVEFELPSASGLEINTDRKLLERAAVEVATVIAERQDAGSKGLVPRVAVTIDEPEDGIVRVNFGELTREHSDVLAKAPFAIAGGGVRLAMARSLAQIAGAMLRLEQDASGIGRFAFSLHRAE